MQLNLIEKLVADFERGCMTRRQLVAQLVGVAAAMAASPRSAIAQATQSDVERAQSAPTFRATGLDHIALDVTDLGRSIKFYERHLGLQRIRGDEDAAFLGQDRDFFLTLFRRERPGLDHYCYSIENYDPDIAMERLAEAGLRPRRTGNRVYFPDPDGITVQVAG